MAACRRQARAAARANLQLEGMSGLELVRELARRGTRAPIIVITAHSESELRQQLLQQG